MNTPGHAVVNLAILGRRDERSRDGAIAAGALLPDAPMVAFWLWAKLIAGLTEEEVWGQAYYEPAWQLVFDLFHSVPLSLVIVGLAWKLGMARTRALGWSLFLHSVFDLPLHNDDAHRHFLPLTDFRFESPVSYWDPDYHGGLVAGLEVVLVFALTVWVLFPRIPSLLWRAGLVAANLYYIALAYVAARFWS